MFTPAITTVRALLPLETTGPAETEMFGAQLAATLHPGDIVALFGDLGVGKTHLIKGLCAEMGVPRHSVNSPTFTLVNEYMGRDFPIYHIDAYRIKHAAEFHELGFEDYFFGEGLCLIEWPERIISLLPNDTTRLQLTHLSENKRRIEWL